MKTSYVNKHQNLMEWRMHKQSWHLDDFFPDFWTKLVFGYNSVNFRWCLIKCYVWSMYLSKRAHSSMFVRACFFEHVCPTNLQKIRTPLLLSSSTFFHQKPSRMVENQPKTLIRTPMYYIFFGPNAISANEYHHFGAKSKFNT